MDNFNELMSEALKDALRRVLGEDISKLVHSLTERRESLRLNAVGNNIDVTIDYLEKLLGKEGARIIQGVSVKRLCLKLKEEYEEVESHFTVLDELYDMKFKLLVPLRNVKQSDCN